MSANTRIYVKVIKMEEIIVEVSAVHLAEAREAAEKMPGVIKVLDAAYTLDDL
jgi:hypothetical protein